MNTINFMYFAHNFSYTQLEECLESTGIGNHFLEKFNAPSNYSGTKRFISLFMNMERSHQLSVVNWIENNYKGI